MKKSLLVILDFYPSVGGVANYWENLLAQMPPESVVVIAPTLPRGTPELKCRYPIYRRALLRWWLVPAWLPLFWHIFAIAKKERVEQIIVGNILPIGTVVMSIARLLKIPYILSTHAMDVTLPLRWKRKERLCRQIIAGAKKIITVSSYTKNKLIELGATAEKITLVQPSPTIHDIKPVAPRDEEILTRIEGKRIILTVGRLTGRKGHADVIRALKNVIHDHQDVVYAIVGTGGERTELENLARQFHLSEHVIFVGSQTRTEIAWWYDRCTFFIMTPFDDNGDVEGFGIIYLEAGEHGKAVIATRSGGVPDAVSDGKTGILIEPRDIAGIADAMNMLLDNPTKAKRMGEQGRTRAQEEFSIQKQAQNLKDALS